MVSIGKSSHAADPDGNVNVIGTHSEVVTDLTQQLHQQMGRDDP
jgi:hypothetical protein